jgi:siroheme synthase (precorrin-2 oxidase/ferrochelatase)
MTAGGSHPHPPPGVRVPIFPMWFKGLILGTYTAMITFGYIFREQIAEHADRNMQKTAHLRALRREYMDEEMERIKARKKEWELLSYYPMTRGALVAKAEDEAKSRERQQDQQ